MRDREEKEERRLYRSFDHVLGNLSRGFGIESPIREIWKTRRGREERM